MKNDNLALFDFDGTITKEDTLIEFIKFSQGRAAFIKGFTLLFPVLLLMKLKLYPNWRSKERVMSFFFAGMTVSKFDSLCETFAKEKIPRYLRNSALVQLKLHKEKGDRVVIITASFENWVSKWADPFCDILIGTRLKISNARITGEIYGKNCYGPEKVNRLHETLDITQFKEIYAYGDSRGDKEMLGLATNPYYQKFN